MATSSTLAPDDGCVKEMTPRIAARSQQAHLASERRVEVVVI
jgi:hypothetical protein